MASRSKNPYSFLSGFVQSREVGRVIAQIDQLSEQGSTHSQTMKWTKADKKWGYFELKWSATRLWAVLKPELHVFVMGNRGIVHVATVKGGSEELVDDSREGPRGRGDLCDMRWIGDHLYVVGMSRQVYRRERPAKWVRRDAGTVAPLGTKEICGFNAIDGLDEEDMVAVGYGGEIWRCVKGKWRKLPSPTKVVLERVRVVKKGLAYAVGQKGVLLRGRGDVWEVLEQDEIRQDIWGMELFKGQLYVATEKAIFRLAKDETVEPVPMGLGKHWTCMHLHANDGVLWSFGTKHVAWTEDASTWNDVTP